VYGYDPFAWYVEGDDARPGRADGVRQRRVHNPTSFARPCSSRRAEAVAAGEDHSIPSTQSSAENRWSSRHMPPMQRTNRVRQVLRQGLSAALGVRASPTGRGEDQGEVKASLDYVPKPVPGFCLFCLGPLSNGSSWCDKECKAGWQRIMPPAQGAGPVVHSVPSFSRWWGRRSALGRPPRHLTP
jgi:hypothetical protein